MKIRPGPTLLGLAGTTAAAIGLVFYESSAAWLAGLLALSMLFLAATDFVDLLHCMRQLSATSSVPDQVWRNRPFVVPLSLSNPSSRRVSLQVRHIVPVAAEPRIWIDQRTIPSRATVVCEQTFRIPIRGLYQYGPIYIRVTGRSGTLEAQKRIDKLDSIRVFPEITANRPLLERRANQSAQQLGKLASVQQWGANMEFESLQEYRSGDDPRCIDWKTTARQRKLIVRRLQVERHRELVIIVDAGRLMGTETEDGTKLDCAVNATIMLGMVAIKSGDRCGLGVFDDRVLHYLDPLSGPAGLRGIMEGLYDVLSRGHESNFDEMFEILQQRQRKRALVVILSDIVDIETSLGLRLALKTLAQRHEVLFVTIRTPLLDAIVHGDTRSRLDMGRQTVAFRLLRDRERTLHTLKNSGVRVLDVEPHNVNSALVRNYIDIRLKKVL